MKTTLNNEHKEFVDLLGGTGVIGNDINSNFFLIDLSNNGLPKASVEALIKHIGISRKTFSEDILDISVKTLERKKSTDKLGRRISSHVIEIARIFQHAIEVFEDEEIAKQWINTPNRALNNLRPLDLLAIPTGLNMVDDILGRIEEGVYS